VLNWLTIIQVVHSTGGRCDSLYRWTTIMADSWERWGCNQLGGSFENVSQCIRREHYYLHALLAHGDQTISNIEGMQRRNVGKAIGARPPQHNHSPFVPKFGGSYRVDHACVSKTVFSGLSNDTKIVLIGQMVRPQSKHVTDRRTHIQSWRTLREWPSSQKPILVKRHINDVTSLGVLVYGVDKLHFSLYWGVLNSWIIKIFIDVELNSYNVIRNSIQFIQFTIRFIIHIIDYNLQLTFQSPVAHRYW